MRLHAYRRYDGALELVVDDVYACGPVFGAVDLGVTDVDLAVFSPGIVLSIGLSARALAQGADAVVVEHALAVRDAPG